MRSLSKAFNLFIAILLCNTVFAQATKYPYAIKYLDVKAEGKAVKMAYMDVLAEEPNGKTVLLFHGKNFNGYYWKDVIRFLNKAGYRVICPDQVGWGKSGKPVLTYSFNMLANNNLQLLDELQIDKVIVVGHSMGGMLATRLALIDPGRVEKLILENPIGLEDYKTFVPRQSIEELYLKELKATYASYKKYQQSYYPVWKPGYEQYVKAQAVVLSQKSFKSVAYINALTYKMIYEQPVINDMQNVNVPTLLIIGQEDRTVVGKDKLPKDKVTIYGNYPELGRTAHLKIPGSKLIELAGVGHIPHIQTPSLFQKHLLDFISN